jgi:hypothetical protein
MFSILDRLPHKSPRTQHYGSSTLGTFAWPKDLPPETTKLKLTPQALAMLTDGVDLRGAKLRPWYERE